MPLSPLLVPVAGGRVMGRELWEPHQTLHHPTQPRLAESWEGSYGNHTRPCTIPHSPGWQTSPSGGRHRKQLYTKHSTQQCYCKYHFQVQVPGVVSVAVQYGPRITEHRTSIWYSTVCSLEGFVQKVCLSCNSYNGPNLGMKRKRIICTY